MTVGLVLPVIFFAMEDPRLATGFAGAGLPSGRDEVVINVAPDPLRPTGPVEQRVRQIFEQGNRHIVGRLVSPAVRRTGNAHGFSADRPHRRPKADKAILEIAAAIDRGNAAREQDRLEQAKDARWALGRDLVTLGLGVVGTIAGLYSTFR